jgi:rhodanese-related sulfurtransferase
MNNPSLHSNPEISAAELSDRLDKGEVLHIIDVREPMEYHTHNVGGINVPVGQLTAQLDDLDWNKPEEIIVICHAGVRSRTAQVILRQNGYTNIRNLTGGLLALRKIKN